MPRFGLCYCQRLEQCREASYPVARSPPCHNVRRHTRTQISKQEVKKGKEYVKVPLSNGRLIRSDLLLSVPDPPPSHIASPATMREATRAAFPYLTGDAAVRSHSGTGDEENGDQGESRAEDDQGPEPFEENHAVAPGQSLFLLVAFGLWQFVHVEPAVCAWKKISVSLWPSNMHVALCGLRQSICAKTV